MILAIDPGPFDSAYVILDKNLRPIEFDKIVNEELLHRVHQINVLKEVDNAVIEMVACYGMAVGAEVFETVFWIGRFWEVMGNIENKQRVFRKDVKMNLCHNMKATDANITQALIDRFAYGVSNHGKGKKDNPGWFYGFKKDIWQAYAVGVTYADTCLKQAS